MSDVSKIHGYNIKDSVARSDIATLQNDVDSIHTDIEGVDEQVTDLEKKMSEIYLNSHRKANFDAVRKVGTIVLPQGHKVQGTEYVDGYLYVCHQLTNESMLYLSKYKYDDLSLVETIEIGEKMHGNGLCKGPGSQLIVCSTEGFSYIDLASFTLTGTITLSGTRPTSLCFNDDMDRCALGSTGQSIFTFYQYSNIADDGTFVEYATSRSTPKANGLVQDSSATNVMIFTLITNSEAFKKYLPNYIRATSWTGVWYADIYLPSDIIEPEGITRDYANNRFVIVNSVGDVYEFDTGDYILATSHFGLDEACVDLQLAMPFNVEKHKVTGSYTSGTQTYTLDWKVGLCTSNFITSQTPQNLIRHYMDMEFPFTAGGTVFKGYYSGTNVTVTFNEPRTGINVKLGYNYNYQSGYLQLANYVIGYLSNGTYTSIVRSTSSWFADENTACQHFADDMETAIASVGSRPYNNVYQFTQGIGINRFPLIPVIHSYYE